MSIRPPGVQPSIMVGIGILFGCALLAATAIAYTKPSGNTGLDPAQIQQIRHRASLG